MSIVRLVKVSVCARRADREHLLAELQRLGCLHLIPLGEAPEEGGNTAAPAEEVRQALRYLTNLRHLRKPITDPEDFDLEAVVAAAQRNQTRRRSAEDLRDCLVERIREAARWGEFRFPEEPPGGYRLWFYEVPHGQMKQVRAREDLIWQQVHKDNRHAYVVVLAREEPDPARMPVARSHVGSLSLRELRRRLAQVEIELEDIAAEHYNLTRWIHLLSANMARAEDAAALRQAQGVVWEEGELCLVQGWAPESDRAALVAYAKREGLALVIEPPAAHERPPTLLRNAEPVAGGQDLVSFYQTPAYRSWDPSLVVFGSFAVFFAMIMADAGYAAVLALGLGYLWPRLGRSEGGRRARVLGASVVGCALVYGMLVGSYFGVSPAPGSLGDTLQVLDLNDFDTMMALSIGIGALHLILANLAAARQAGGWPAGAPPLGWVAVILGALLYGIARTGEPGPALFSTGGIALMLGGAALVLLYSAPVSEPPLRRLITGLLALTQITKAFGDILSYLRLFALGLASASLALTFNGLASDIQAALPGTGLLLSLLVLLLGHTINLALAIVSGFVHGLRLNFIEFFNWGISDEGYPFKAFARKERVYE